MKNGDWQLKEVVGPVIWTYVKSIGIDSKNDIFQNITYQEWNKAMPLVNCTPWFKKWWLECKDKEKYQANTDWETYYKETTVGGGATTDATATATEDESATEESNGNQKIIENITKTIKKRKKKERKKAKAKAKADAKAKAEAEAKAKAEAEDSNIPMFDSDSDSDE